MRKAKKYAFLLTAMLTLALLITSFGALPVYADENSDIRVTATTSASVKQGYSGYCYVYIDSLEALSTLSVTVHFDAEKVSVQSGYAYNTVSSLLNDKSVSKSSVQFSCIFDGNGKAEKTQLFYFRYTVLSNAEVGDTYFDIVVNEAYDSSLQPVSVSGSRRLFTIAETVTTKTCNVYSSSTINTSVAEEFELSYRLNTYQIASGSFVVNYDPELFEVVSVENGSFCDNKIIDVNTKLAGSVYVSFVGTEYKSNYDLLKVKFKTLKNVTESSTIKLTVTEFYDLDLNPISCSGYLTTAKIAFDDTYTADSPSMFLQTAYNSTTDKVTLTIKLDKDSTLGAGDFVLRFDTNYLVYAAAEKGFSPTFFNVNDKNVNDGVLKFSIISLSDITDAQTVLTVIFDVEPSCSDRVCGFEISGSGLTDSLTNSILLNFVDASITIPLKHTVSAAVEESRVEATCEGEGSCDLGIYCSTCGEKLSTEHKTITALGHDCVHHEGKAATCTEAGYKAYDTCSRCEYTTYEVSEALGHKEASAVEENRVEATCETDGSYDLVVYCSACGEELSRKHKTITAFGHNTLGKIEHKDADCTDDGVVGGTYCTRCNDGKEAAETVIPALGHDEVKHDGKSATCAEKGWNAYVTCSRCDYSTYQEVLASGHSYGRWTCDKQATKDAEGHEYRECANCHAREERVIGKLAGGCIDTGTSSIITVDISLLLAAVLFAVRRKS